MAYTPVEIIALIVIIAAVVKMLVLLTNPAKWMNLAKSVYKRPRTVSLVSLILAAIVLYYLLQELTIVQIIATVAFTALLVLISLASEVDSFIKKYEAKIKNGTLWQEYWLYALIWIVLLAWAAYALFM